MEIFFDVSLYSVINIDTVHWQTSFRSVEASNYFSIILFTILCSAFIALVLKYRANYSQWHTKEFRGKYGTFL